MQALEPGHEEREYVDADLAWFTSAIAKSRQILLGILPELEKSDSATVTRFTYGQGTTGMIREAHSQSSHEFDQQTCLRPCVAPSPIGLEVLPRDNTSRTMAGEFRA